MDHGAGRSGAPAIAIRSAATATQAFQRDDVTSRRVE
jgi:hypothetical protein